MSSAMHEELDRAMRMTRGRIETTVGRICDEFSLTPEEVATVLYEMSEMRVRFDDGTHSKRYDLLRPWDPATAHRSQVVALQMGGWFFDQVDE